MLNRLYRVLEHPACYQLSQLLFAPGADFFLKRLLQRIIQEQPVTDMLLDVGCGPASQLFDFDLKPVGLDLSHSYLVAYTRHSAPGVVSSATALPFAPATFDSVWSTGLLHHLPDSAVRHCLDEIMRVVKPQGVVVLFDAVKPHSVWRRPPAALIRRLDRGRYMRNQEELAGLLPTRESWTIERYTYTLTGLEMLLCLRRGDGTDKREVHSP